MSFSVVVPCVSTTVSLARMKIDGIVYLVDPITCKAYTCDDTPTEVGYVVATATDPIRIHIRPDIQAVLHTKRDALRAEGTSVQTDAAATPILAPRPRPRPCPTGSHSMETTVTGTPTRAA